MEKLNIAKLLKDCPTGMELDCALFENLEFDHIDKNSGAYSIICRVKTEWGGYNVHTFTEYGCYSTEKYSKCVIFPKGKTTWEGFQRPFKNGDIVTDIEGEVIIYKGIKTCGYCGSFVSLDRYNQLIPHYESYLTDCIRFATKEEKQKLFDAIKANGYKWNPETKTLEKLIIPKFKAGDKIEKCSYRFTITEVKEDYYLTKCGNKIPIEYQDDFNLISDKFNINTLKSFESRVLVRNIGAWEPAFWGYYSKEYAHPFVVTSGNTFAQCVPYEENQHLLGTTDDCSSYYKTWE